MTTSRIDCDTSSPREAPDIVRLRGRVVHFNAERGFGKVRGDDRREYFAHRDDLIDVLALMAGQDVRFESIETEKGSRAVNVEVLPERSGAIPTTRRS